MPREIKPIPDSDISPSTYARRAERYIMEAFCTLKAAQDKYGMENADYTMSLVSSALHSVRSLVIEEMEVAADIEPEQPGIITRNRRSVAIKVK